MKKFIIFSLLSCFVFQTGCITSSVARLNSEFEDIYEVDKDINSSNVLNITDIARDLNRNFNLKKAFIGNSDVELAIHMDHGVFDLDFRVASQDYVPPNN